MQRTQSRLMRRENAVGWAFVTPALITFLVLTAFPFFLSLFLSFTKWNFLSGWDHIKMIGLKNFQNMMKDKRFIQALENTFVYAATTVPISIIVSLLLA